MSTHENPSRPLRVTILQTDIEWQAPSANLARLTRLLHEAPKSDLYLLPEMFATGFCMNPEVPGVSDAAADTFRWMQHEAEELDSAIAGSLPVKTDGLCHNRFAFVTPESTTTYDKHHLFTYGGEKRAYTEGRERIVVSFRGVRFLLQVCYDLRFPVFSRNRADYDAILYVANWPTSRIDVWDILLRARAIENQCYVLASNRIGSDPACTYPGHSQAVDAYGRVAAACEEGRESFVSLSLDMERLAAFREKFPVLSDGDKFNLL